MGLIKNILGDIRDSRKIHYNLKPISGDEAMQELINHFLGKNWYVVDPLSQTQVNAIALDEIKAKYPIPIRKIILKNLGEYFKYKGDSR